MKTPTGAAWRPEATVCSLEGSRGSRRLRTCSVLAAAATLVLLGIACPRGTPRQQPVAPSPLFAVQSADRDVPDFFGPTLPISSAASSHGGAVRRTQEALRHDNVQHQQPGLVLPDWYPANVNLTSCMAEDDDETPFTVQDFEAARPGRLRVEATFYSAQQPALPVTVTVTATNGKLSALQGLCESWPGPLSVAFYLAVVADGSSVDESVAAAVAAVNAAFQKLEAAGRCQADVVVYLERVADEAAAALFPINILRNNAILAARTPLVLLADADLLIGADLAAAMADPSQYQQALDLSRQKHFLVVPTLETLRTSRAYTCAKGGKSVAVEHMQGGKAWGFKTQHSDFLHGSTDFPRWATAEAPYSIHDTHDRYEPWGLMYRPALGFFDVRYRGYGRNKVQHLHMHMKQLGWRYSVHPWGYMVHRPHKVSAAKQQFMAGLAIAAEATAAVAAGAEPRAALATAAQSSSGNLLVFGTNNGFFEDQKAAGDRYRPLLTLGFQRCRAQLPWWQIYGPSGEPIQAVTAPLPPQQEPETATT